MTTVAYRNGILAVDSISTFGNARPQKVYRAMDCALVAGAGHLTELIRWFKWYDGGMEDDAPSIDNTDILVVLPDGTAHTFEEMIFMPLSGAPFWAFGSGRDFALGAMHAGASAAVAAAAGAALDPFSGGEILTYRAGE